jgi:hypothetical protein
MDGGAGVLQGFLRFGQFSLLETMSSQNSDLAAFNGLSHFIPPIHVDA